MSGKKCPFPSIMITIYQFQEIKKKNRLINKTVKVYPGWSYSWHCSAVHNEQQQVLEQQKFIWLISSSYVT